MPKPLIEVDGKPIIEHVVNMFPGEEDFLFICNEDHLDETSYKMREVLNRICPMDLLLASPHTSLALSTRSNASKTWWVTKSP